MVIGRKMIVPMLLILALLILAAVGYFASTAARELAAEQERNLLSLELGLQEELSRLEEISLALARQMAVNPAAEDAFGARDYEALLAISRPGLLSLRGAYRISAHRFTQAPATVLLDVVNPERSGQDLSSSQPMLVASNTQGIDAAGLDLAENGLNIQGVSPIEGHSPSGAPVNGSVVYSLPVDASIFSDLRTRFGGEWQVMLHIPAATAAGIGNITPVDLPPGVSGPADLALQSTTLDLPVFAPPEQYRTALEGKSVMGTVQNGERRFAILTTPLKDFSGQVVGVVDILWDRTALAQQLTGRVTTALLIGLGALLLAALLLNMVIERTLSPIKAVTVAADAFARGNLRHPLPVTHPDNPRPDEVEQLSRSFSTISQQLRHLAGSLETTVAERTHNLELRAGQLEAAADIARQSVSMANVDDLLAQAASLTRQHFDLYHVGVYLVDATGEFVQLRAAAGEHSRRLLDSGRRQPISRAGTDQDLVTAVVAAGQTIISADITQDPFYQADPLLTEGRAQAALPLVAGNKVVGALDVHSRQPGAFGGLPGENRPDTGGILSALQIIADQIASAINNARLIETLERTVAEVGEARGQQASENWQAFMRGRPTAVGYRYISEDNRKRGSVAGGLQALDRFEALANPGSQIGAVEDGEADTNDDLNIPIRLRGQEIGAIQLRFDTPASRPQIESVVEEVSSRLALLLESARLLEEAQRRAQREQQINLIATQMRSSVELDAVLQSTVRELGKALGARRTYIQLGETAAADVAEGSAENAAGNAAGSANGGPPKDEAEA